MITRTQVYRNCVASILFFGLVAGPLTSPVAQAAQQESASAEVNVDGGWPRIYETPLGAEVVLYQPQISDWERQAHMTAYAAVSYFPKGEKEAALGTIKLEADTSVALEERLVSFASLKVTEVSFPTLEESQTRDMVTEITRAIPEEDRVIALDRILAAIDLSQVAPKNVEGIKADPPTVFHSTSPALLVVLDGEPVWCPVQDSPLRFAVNTNWDLFQEGSDGAYYLRNENTWLKASDLKGAWTPAGALPDSFSKLPDSDWSDVRAAVPGEQIADTNVPTVFVHDGPAELIVTEGAPKYEPVQGTSLLWVSNTESDLFRFTKDGPHYYLVAGRWFAAIDLAGPWVFSTPDLPEDFKAIPADHPRVRVLSSVPGSSAAMEAILLAQIPQTARVKMSEVEAPETAYQGDPQFETIAGTSLQMAVNTDKAIIKVGDVYYMCFQGVWFTAGSPEGPWEVTKSIPEEIYSIPPSSPVHNVTYVTAVEDDDDEWAEFVCAAGYTGLMVAWGSAVWGTGYYYPPYVWYGERYPVYYPRPVTYGCNAWYNPWTGRYGYANGAYGPYGGIGAGAVYNPETGTYARGSVAYGPNGARGKAQVWNPRTETYAQTRQGSNVYGSWGATYVKRGDDWAATKRYTNNATGTTTRVIRTDDGAALVRRGGENGPMVVAGGDGGNMYAGVDGNVYRKEDDGSWQSWEREGWKKAEGTVTLSNVTEGGPKEKRNEAPDARGPVQTPNVQVPVQRPVANLPAPPGDFAGQVANPVAGQLNRDALARQAGAQRTREFNNYRGGQMAQGMAPGNRGGAIGNGPGNPGNRAGGVAGGRGGARNRR